MLGVHLISDLPDQGSLALGVFVIGAPLGS